MLPERYLFGLILLCLSSSFLLLYERPANDIGLLPMVVTLLIWLIGGYLITSVSAWAFGRPLQLNNLKMDVIYRNLSHKKEMYISEGELYTLITDGKWQKIFKLKSEELPRTEFFRVDKSPSGKTFAIGMSGEKIPIQQ
jgi:hypothetical protein